MAILKSTHQAKNKCNFDSVWLEKQHGGLHDSSDPCETNRFAWCWRKLKENIFKNNNQISSTLTSRTWVLWTKWTRTEPIIGIRMKKRWWFTYVWPVDVVLLCPWVLYRIKKGQGDERSKPLLTFWRHVVDAIFQKCWKKDRLFSNRLGIQNIPSDVSYDDTKHYLVQSEHRRIQNPFKHQEGLLLCKHLTA